MANSIFVEPKSSDVSSDEAFVLHGNRDRADGGADMDFIGLGGRGKYIYESWSITSPGAMQEVPYTGYEGRDAKYMGGNTNRIVIHGYVIDHTANYKASDAHDGKTIATNLLDLLDKNKLLTTWEVTLGQNGTTMSSTSDCVIQDIVSGDMGAGSGPRWPFTISFVNLGKAR